MLFSLPKHPFSGSLLAVLLLVSTACSTTPATQNSNVSVTETASFSEVKAVVQTLNAKYGANKVLIVSDIDNTLLTSATDLGGDIWYQWQRGKLGVKPTPEQKVSCLFEDTISLLYELAPMTLTEPAVPALLSDWANSGNTLLLLTSRAPKNRSATERELLRNGIDVSLAALAPEGNVNPVYREKLEREMSYSRGVMMTTGMNKGTMLHWILDQTNREFDAVVFIDDSYPNIKNMQEAWRDGDLDMQIFHYTHVESERIKSQGAVLTSAQANQMAADYSRLLNTLNSVFPARVNDGQCLGQ